MTLYVVNPNHDVMLSAVHPNLSSATVRGVVSPTTGRVVGWWLSHDGVVSTAGAGYITIGGSSVVGSSQTLSSGTQPVSGPFLFSPNTATVTAGQYIGFVPDGNTVSSNVTSANIVFVVRK